MPATFTAPIAQNALIASARNAQVTIDLEAGQVYVVYDGFDVGNNLVAPMQRLQVTHAVFLAALPGAGTFKARVYNAIMTLLGQTGVVT